MCQAILLRRVNFIKVEAEELIYLGLKLSSASIARGFGKLWSGLLEVL